MLIGAALTPVTGMMEICNITAISFFFFNVGESHVIPPQCVYVRFLSQSTSCENPPYSVSDWSVDSTQGLMGLTVNG